MTNARKFFDENLRSLGPTPQFQLAKDAERFNLYTGLSQMSDQLTEVQAELVGLQAQIAGLEQAVQRLMHLCPLSRSSAGGV